MIHYENGMWEENDNCVNHNLLIFINNPSINRHVIIIEEGVRLY